MPILMGRGVVSTGIDCPLCKEAGHTNYGGRTPTLRKLDDGSDDRPFCMGLHGFISAEEMV